MERHEFDPVSFVFGVVFLLVAAAVGLTERPWRLVLPWTAEWLWPLLLVAVGLALVIPAVRRRDDQGRG